MNIVILQGSPNIKESTNLLVESFTKSANESGHNVKRFDICNMGINPCNGCGTPSMTHNSKYMQEAYELGKNI